MATTYTLISSVTVGSGGAANIEFTSIPNTYTDLLLKVSLRSATNDTDEWTTLTFNGTSSGYSQRVLGGNGTAAFSISSSGAEWNYTGEMNAANSTASTFNNTDIYIPNYAGSNNKSISVDSVMEQNATKGIASLGAGLLSNSAAITSIRIKPNTTANLVQYSTAYLYGISNA